VVLTWQEPQTFNTVVYKVWYGQSQGITAANILVSEDGENWQEVASKKNMGYKANDETLEEHIFQFPVTTATALKLQVMNANLAWNQFAVNELYVTREPTPGD
jgi:hypothetical protein